MITPEFKTKVEALRAEGKSWPQISKIVGRPQRTCQRAVGMKPKLCKEANCDLVATPSGNYCRKHGISRMVSNKAGEGPRQQEVLKLIQNHGFLSAEQLRVLTDLNATHLNQVTGRLLNLGLIERPVRGYYSVPRPHVCYTGNEGTGSVPVKKGG